MLLSDGCGQQGNVSRQLIHSLEGMSMRLARCLLVATGLNELTPGGSPTATGL